jgi:hypothetical protein
MVECLDTQNTTTLTPLELSMLLIKQRPTGFVFRIRPCDDRDVVSNGHVEDILLQQPIEVGIKKAGNKSL